MISEIIIDAGANETRAALLEDKELVELYIERPFTERLVGNIYRGKVLSVLPGIQAAFVDIGYERNAFLYVGDAVLPKNTPEDYEQKIDFKTLNIQDVVSVGQELTVQVIKEPAGNKGPRVSINITLPGRNLVLLPKVEYIGVSRRIEDEAQKSKLKDMAQKVKPERMGLIVRTASVEKQEEDLREEVDFLIKLWKKIEQSEQSGNVPRCLHKDLSLIYRVVRDIFTENISKLVIKDTETYNKVLELVDIMSPKLKNRVEYFSKDYEIFDYYNIDTVIARALSRKVWLKSGGYLVIDQTEALTVVDVNTGKYVGVKNLEDTVLKTNLEAAREIAKQLRLRDIGGIIVVDFIDMDKENDQNMIIEALEEELKKDKTKAMVVGMTKLGLIEMTRKKTGHRLSSIMQVDCPICEGSGKVLSSAKKGIDIESVECYNNSATARNGHENAG